MDLKGLYSDCRDEVKKINKNIFLEIESYSECEKYTFLAKKCTYEQPKEILQFLDEASKSFWQIADHEYIKRTKGNGVVYIDTILRHLYQITKEYMQGKLKNPVDALRYGATPEKLTFKYPDGSKKIYKGEALKKYIDITNNALLHMNIRYPKDNSKFTEPEVDLRKCKM